MISGWFSGQPVAKAVTKSAEVDRFVIERSFSKVGSAVVSVTPAAEQLARGASMPLLALSPARKRLLRFRPSHADRPDLLCRAASRVESFARATRAKPHRCPRQQLRTRCGSSNTRSGERYAQAPP